MITKSKILELTKEQPISETILLEKCAGKFPKQKHINRFNEIINSLLKKKKLIKVPMNDEIYYEACDPSDFTN